MLYIMRHGKTEWNDLQRLQGQTDIPLNENGRLMAKKAAEEYRDVHFDICYSSPLIRAFETAQTVLEGRDIPIVTDERLKEMSFGIYEGETGYWDRADFPLRKLFNEPDQYRKSIGGAESFEQLFERTGLFLDELIRPGLKKGQDILIVGHGAMNSAIVCQIKKIPLKDFWSAGIENCKLMKLI